MLEKIIGDLGKMSSMEAHYFWGWADSHPYLHTIIEITDSFLYVIIGVGAYLVVKHISRKDRVR